MSAVAAVSGAVCCSRARSNCKRQPGSTGTAEMASVRRSGRRKPI